MAAQAEVVERADVLAALESLPARDRMIVALRDVIGLTAAEAAAAVGIDEDEQCALLHRGRTRLLTELERNGGSRVRARAV